MKPSRSLRLSLRMLVRDWRAGELRILALALIVAVGSVTTVGFFTDRVQLGMERQAGALLGADLVVRASDPIAPDRSRQAQQFGLRTAHTVSFRSVVFVGDRTQLVEVKAVGPGYPLRGQLRIAAAPFAPERAVTDIPARATLWVAPRLLALLQVRVGDSLNLGSKRFRIAAVLTDEPDRGGDLFSIAPRVLMNLADLPATELLAPGSRATYQLLVAGTDSAVRRYQNWLKSHLGNGERVVDVREGRPELRFALERAGQFLGLAALVSVLLAGVAIATATRRFVQRHLDATAMMRCLGATQATVLRLFAAEVLWLALLASTAGVLLGLAAQEGLNLILGRLLLGDLPAPPLRSLFTGYLTGLITLLGFAVPPLLRLRHVPPARVLHRELGALDMRSATTYAAVVGAMVLLMAWQVNDAKLIAYLLGGSAATLLLLLAGARLLVTWLGRLRGHVGTAWRFGFANIARRPQASAVQIVAFGLGLMVLLLLALVRSDLLDDWRRSLPADAPNYFLINVQPDQVRPLQRFFAAHALPAPTLYPMVRARLTAVNGRPVHAADYSDPRARRLVQREFNLSWAKQPQVDNRVVAGQWWNSGDRGRPLLSLEQELANTLGLHLGDRLSFDIAGTPLEVTVTNLRHVNWDTFRVNFFAVLPPGVLDSYPATWVTSIHLGARQRDALAPLVRQFPNITVLDVAALLTRVRDIIEHVALAVQYVFAFTLLAGLAVLYAAIQAHQDERRYESAMLRTLGARRSQLLRGLLAEFVTLGALAGLLAGAAATLIGYALAEHLFRFPFVFNPAVIILGILGGSLGIGLAGVLGTRRVLDTPPLSTLREGSGT